METQVISNAGTLDPFIWERLAHPSLYLSSNWLRARSRTIKGAERFVLVTGVEGCPLVGVPAYLIGSSSHPGFNPARVLAIDDLTDAEIESVPGAIDALAELRGMLRQRGGEWTPSLVVSTPGRYGGISYGTGIAADAAHSALVAAVEAVERQARADEARSICWLYFAEDEDPLLAATLHERGYLSVVVDAECYLPLRWDDFQGYLSSFPARYRYKIRHEMAAFDKAGGDVELRGGEALGPDLAQLELKWREKYGRTPPLADIIADYENLRSYLMPNLRVFVATLRGRTVGFTLFLQHEDIWYARFGGFDYSVGNLFLYFNLLFYRPIQFFVERGVRLVHYSLKSYQAKASRGCLLKNVIAYVRPPEGWTHVGDLLEIVDRAQRFRFDTIMSRRSMRGPA